MTPPRAAAPRVGLIGHFGIGNLGNDASLDVVAASLVAARPGTTIVPVCHRPGDVAEPWAAHAVPIHVPRPRSGPARLGRVLSRARDLRHAADVVRTLDALLVPGTGILDDFGGERGAGFPSTLLQWLGMARLAGVPTGLLSVGAGPFRDRLGRILIRRLVGVVDYRSFRDASSVEFVRGLGAAVGLGDVVPDVVLALPAPDSAPSSRSRVVIAVMQYTGWYHSGLDDRHERAFARLAEWALGEGHDVMLLTADAKDRPATDRVAALVRAATGGSTDARLQQAQAGDLGEVVAAMAGASLVAVTRYHSLVAALVAGRPVVSVGYGSKNDELMAAAGLGDYCQHVETVDAQLLVEQAARALRNGAALAASVTAAGDGFRDRLATQQNAVLDLIDGHHRTRRAAAPRPARAQAR
jgi:polysaccharide pyruvyl transferase WcaK-like protein